MRNITIKGVGRVQRKPDLIVLSLVLKTQNDRYDATLDELERKLGRLTRSLINANFNASDLLTRNFSVDTYYENERQSDGSYKSVFKAIELNRP